MPDLTYDERRAKQARARTERLSRGLKADEIDVISYCHSRCCHVGVLLLRENRGRRCRGCGNQWAPGQDESHLIGQRFSR